MSRYGSIELHLGPEPVPVAGPCAVTNASAASTRDASDAQPPRITVATVVRNGAATLDRVMESVLALVGAQVEYVVVDGASSDGSVDIIRSHAKRLAGWISEPDGGVYDAMNKALAMARGDWLIFIGADDILLPALASTATRLVDRDAIYYGDVEIAGTGAVSGGRFNRYRLMQENICHQAVLYPRSVYRTTRYDLGAGILADHKYNIELWGRGVRFRYLPCVVSRFNPAGLSSGADAQARFEPIKMQAIRTSFGPGLHAVKRTRSALVRLLKGRRDPA